MLNQERSSLLNAEESSLPDPERSSLLNAVRVGVAILGASIYCLIFLVRPSASWPLTLRRVMSGSSGWVRGCINSSFGFAGFEQVSPEVSFGVYLVVIAGLVPWLTLAVLRRGRPYDLGCRRPNRIAWRVTLVGYLIALPLMVWMARGAGFASHYLPHLDRAGLGPYLLFYLANLVSEHFLFHGVMLSVFRTQWRWPASPPIAANATGRLNRSLQWLGLAQPVSGQRLRHRVTQWAGLPDGCGVAIIASGLLFGLVHAGKDPRELLLSVPGGIVSAYLAYRTNSWLTPFVLHLATAGTALAMIIYAR